MNKRTIINAVLWLSYLLALAASVGHVAWAFGILEFPGSEPVGWLAAIAVDAGLAALAYGVQQRKRARRGTRYLWMGVIMFTVISAFANLLHAMTAMTGLAVTLSTFVTLDTLALVKAVVLSASLPLMVVYMGEVVSSDDVKAAEHAERERAQAERERAQAEQAEVSTTGSDEQSDEHMVHARNVKAEQDAALKAEALDTLAERLNTNPNTSVTELSHLIGRSRTTTYRYLDELKQDNGRVNA